MSLYVPGQFELMMGLARLRWAVERTPQGEPMYESLIQEILVQIIRAQENRTLELAKQAITMVRNLQDQEPQAPSLTSAA